MNCKRYGEWLSEYTDGVLGAARRQDLEAHLGVCTPCRGEADGLRALTEDLRSLASPAAPDLLPAIRARLQQQEAGWGRWLAPLPVSLPWHGLAVATAALLIILVGRPKPPVNAPQMATISSTAQEAQSRRGGAVLSHPERLLAPEDINLVEVIEPQDQTDSIEIPSEREMTILAQAPRYTSDFSDNSDDEPMRRQFTRGYGMLDLVSAYQAVQAGRPAPYRAGFAARPAGAFMQSPGLIEVQRFSPSPASAAPELLELRWYVSDVELAIRGIVDWANSHNGFAIVTTPSHLSVMLPGKEVPAFLKEFSSDITTANAFGQWVTLSIQLIEAQ